MRLATKLVLLFLVGLLLIVGLFSYLTIQQGKRFAMAGHERYASDLAATLRPSIQDAMRGSDHEVLQQVVTQSTREVRHVRARWVKSNSPTEGTMQPLVPIQMIISKEQITTVSVPDHSGQDVIYTYVPISDDEIANGDQTGSIEISAPDVESDQRLLQSLLSSLIALVGVATLSGIVIILGGIVMVGKPLNQLIEKVQRAGQGDFDGPLRLRSTDELGRLSDALNQMCVELAQQRDQLEAETTSRIATLNQLRHSDRLNTIGRMAAGIAHEIGTPLNVVTGRAELIASGQLSAEVAHESAEVIRSEAQRITKTIRELLDFSRQSAPHPTRQVLGEVIQASANLMRPLSTKHGIEIKVVLPSEPLDADIDTAQLQQVLTNLIVNAVHATANEGDVSITLSDVIAKRPDGQRSPYRKIAIRDDGAGISEQDREHIFEPFFTTKDVGEGTGLGLSISHGIIFEHHGWIDVESEVDMGSCFSIYLPAPSDEEAIETKRDEP